MIQKSAENKSKPHYFGHRERLRSRFLVDNGKSMPDYEIMELLLTMAIPRRDVKPLAKKLIDEFGSFGKAINATQNQLSAFGLSLNTITVFKIVVAAAQKMSWQEFSEKDEPVFSSFDYMIDYCRTALGYLDVEEFRVIFLDAKLHPIKEQTMQRGTVNAVSVHAREVVKEALGCGAISVILMHNHPGGKAKPSQADILNTNEIADALYPLKISIQDHIIITKDGYYSFRDQGMLKYSNNYKGKY